MEKHFCLAVKFMLNLTGLDLTLYVEQVWKKVHLTLNNILKNDYFSDIFC